MAQAPSSSPPPPAGAGRSRPTSDARRRALRVGRGLAVGLVVAGLVLVGRRSGLLTGAPALALTVVGLLAVPTSTQPARRVLWVGCLLAGWAPLLWWRPVPTAGLGRVAWLLAALLGGLAGWVAAGPVRMRLARLVPRVRWVDAAIPVTAVLGLGLLQSWLTVRTPLRALAVLATNRDAAIHFAMTLAVRRGDAAVPAVPPAPDGTRWIGTHYPQPFHLLAASVTELLDGPQAAAPGEELVRHAHAVALLVAAGVSVVVAGIVALPALRRRPALGWPAAAVTAGALLLGPGADAVMRGHWPFLLTVAAVIAGGLAALQVPVRWHPVPVAAAAGTLVAVAHAWGLLGCVAVPAVAVALLPASRRRWWALLTAARGLYLAVLLATVAASLVVLVWLRSGDAGALATATGWVQAEPPLMLGVVLAAAVAVPVVLARRRPRGLVERRLIAAVGVPVLGLVAVTGLLVEEIRTTGAVAYFGAKLLAGVYLVVLPLTAVALAHLLHLLVPAGRAGDPARGGGRWLAVGVPVGVSVAVLTAWAVTGPGLHQRSVALAEAERPGANAVALDRAVAVQRDRPFGTVLYLPTGPGKYGVFFADSWFIALTGTASYGRGVPVQDAPQGWELPGEVPRLLRAFLEADPRRVVVVRPAELEATRRAVADPQLAQRVITW